MARELGYLPVATDDRARHACSAMGGPMTNYLIRFAYADGRALWVGSAEEVNNCVRTTNGTAHTNAYAGDGITAAYREGVWRRKPAGLQGTTSEPTHMGTLGPRPWP